jgi:hypothetical protein
MNHKIYFNAAQHKYYDSFNNPFVSVTTTISKYHEHFDTEKMAKVCYLSGLKGNPKYRGKTIADIKAEWKKRNLNSLAKGTEDHDYLETAVKGSGNYYRGTRHLESKQLYTIEDVLQDETLGVLDLNSPELLEVKELYPYIYRTFELLVANGWRILSEVAVFSLEYLISGLIDILAIKGREFKILDWKTNNDTIMFDAGYWEHDKDYNITGYKRTYKNLLPPLNHLAHSVGIEYTLQLSTYALLAEAFGLTCTGILLYHIRKFSYTELHDHLLQNPTWSGKRQLDTYKIDYLKNDVKLMLTHQIQARQVDIGHKLKFGL